MYKPSILMLEDDPDDRFLTEATVEELALSVSIKFVRRSEELFIELKRGDAPSLIILDFNSLPLNAVSILKALKAESAHRLIPVVVLGDSNDHKYVGDCYFYGANTFIQKPRTMAETKSKIEAFFRYWLEVAKI